MLMQQAVMIDDGRCEQAMLVQRICDFIDDNLEDTPTLDDLSARFNISPFHLQRTFKSVMGITPRQYAEWQRLGSLKRRLRAGENVTDALYNVGFGSSSRLYERSDIALGMTPATYGRGGDGMHIHYTIVESELGLLLVAMTEKGICAVYVGRDERDLEASLYHEYPAAHIERNRIAMCDWVNDLLEHIRGRHPHLDLPLDVQATAFERLVWQELRRIPYGETRTYAEIAAAIGHPRAVAAVAQACHANPATLLIPCHRVNRQDGNPSSRYRGREIDSYRAIRQNEQKQIARHRHQEEA
jgi:AraC family transcriptional regulator of adaptative response/methylated-DNA-[protein]-cysteine methyltransferase